MTAFKMPPLPATETTTSDHKDGCGEPAYLPEVVARYGKEVYAAALDAAAAIIQARVEACLDMNARRHMMAAMVEIVALKKPDEQRAGMAGPVVLTGGATR